MKRFLAALSIAIVLVIGYSLLAILISSIVLGSPTMMMDPALSWPISLPRMVYTAIAPNFIQDAAAASPLGGVVERLLFLIGNVLIYALPIYALIGEFKKRRSA